MSSSPKEIGTLIVVVLKAKNLPNKRHIGKQDPYCAVTLHDQKRRTKAIKRGGQHPEWDDEFRFSIYEDVEDLLARTAQGPDTPPTPPPKNSKDPKRIKGGKSMKLQCYADDPRDPDLIGETMVDLTEVLTKGETDEWFTLMHKDKYCGEVYLELTFWSNERPPEKKTTPKPATVNNKQYGGPGSFVPAGDMGMGGTSSHSSSRIGRSGNNSDASHLDSLPSSLRASNSKVDLYAPPYEQRNKLSPNPNPVDQIANDFGELHMSDPHRRRESFPPHTPNPHMQGSWSLNNSSISGYGSQGFDQNGYLDNGPSVSIDSVTPTALQYSNNYSGSAPYRAQHEASPAPGAYQPPARHPRYSMPTSSSGFMPMPAATPSPSTLLPLPPYPSDPSGFGQLPGHVTIPLNQSPHHPGPTGYVPPPVTTPVQSNFVPSAPPVPPSSSASFHQSYGATPYQYTPYNPTPAPQEHYPPPLPPQSAPPPQHYRPPTTLPPPPPPAQSVPPQTYHNYDPTTPSPPHDYISPLPLSQSISTMSMGSRPLPQPQQTSQQHQNYTQHPTHRQSSLTLPPSSSFPQQFSNSQSPTRPYPPGSVSHQNAPYQNIPPPPPAPSHIQYGTPPQSYSAGQHSPNAGLPNVGAISLPPPPPPPSVTSGRNPSPARSLPQPGSYHQQAQQPMYQSIPPPPPPPDMLHHGLPPPVSHNQSYYQAPPPRPPGQLTEQPHWGPSSTPAGYVQPTHATQDGRN